MSSSLIIIYVVVQKLIKEAKQQQGDYSLLDEPMLIHAFYLNEGGNSVAFYSRSEL